MRPSLAAWAEFLEHGSLSFLELPSSSSTGFTHAESSFFACSAAHGVGQFDSNERNNVAHRSPFAIILGTVECSKPAKRAQARHASLGLPQGK